MKKTILLTFALLSVVFLASTVWGLSINDGSNTDVGAWDTFLAGTNNLGSSSEALELTWMQYVTGDTTLTYTQYDDGYDEISIYNVNDTTDGYAFALNGEPDFFLIKWGNGGNTDDPNTEYVAWTAWTNSEERDWAVISLSDSGLLAAGWEIKNIDAFSHYGETGAAPVPEPATILLLGAGLLGTGVVTRRKI